MMHEEPPIQNSEAESQQPDNVVDFTKYRTARAEQTQINEQMAAADSVLEGVQKMREERLRLTAELKQNEMKESEFFIEANDLLKDGAAVDTVLAVREKFLNPVFRQTLLRNCIAETAARGEVDRALSLVDLEEDAGARQRDMATIAIGCARVADFSAATKVLSSVASGQYRDHALRIIVPLLAEEDRAHALKLAGDISDTPLRISIIDSIQK